MPLKVKLKASRQSVRGSFPCFFFSVPQNSEEPSFLLQQALQIELCYCIIIVLFTNGTVTVLSINWKFLHGTR